MKITNENIISFYFQSSYFSYTAKQFTMDHHSDEKRNEKQPPMLKRVDNFIAQFR